MPVRTRTRRLSEPCAVCEAAAGAPCLDLRQSPPAPMNHPHRSGGPVVTPTMARPLCVRLPDELHQRLTADALANGETTSDRARKAIAAYTAPRAD